MILYFTGTDNSKYVAESLADKLSDESVSMNDYIKSGEIGNFNSEKPYIFVVPVYLATMPEIVRNFVSASHFAGNSNAYFISTCAGDDLGVPNAARKLCEKHSDLTFMGSIKVQMPQNYIALFTMTDEAEKQRRYEAAENTLTEVAKIIHTNQILADKPISRIKYGLVKWVEKLYNKHFTKTKKLKITDGCMGCSICEKKCPVNAIKMVDGHPVWIKKKCIHCMSCINRCPKQAIEYGKKTATKERHICKPYKRS